MSAGWDALHPRWPRDPSRHRGQRRAQVTCDCDRRAAADRAAAATGSCCVACGSAHPGSSGAQVQPGLGMRHLSQASRLLIKLDQLLIKLEQQGLVHTDRSRRAPNAWRLTEQGRALLDGLPEGIYE
jgi:hypothetical protein